jgi:uncharacterized membrane-anchored protein YitT (DUF2179 family)
VVCLQLGEAYARKEKAATGVWLLYFDVVVVFLVVVVSGRRARYFQLSLFSLLLSPASFLKTPKTNAL